MEIVIVSWLILCLIIGSIGSKRKIGFGKAFLFSLLLSPLLGLIIVLSSKTYEQLEYEEKLLKTNQQQLQAIENLLMKNNGQEDDLLSIKQLYDSRIINSDEFETLKNKIINSCDNDSSIDSSISKCANPYLLIETNEIASMISENAIKYLVKFDDGFIGDLYFRRESNDWIVSFTNENEYFSNKDKAIEYLHNMLTNESFRRAKIEEEIDHNLIWNSQKDLKYKQRRKNNISAILFFIAFVLLIIIYSLITSQK
jgi:hypothetical protein